MVHLILLAFGVCMALLCHWLIRHTYHYRSEEVNDERFGGKRRIKVWAEKMVLPRWVYVLIWSFCILLAPLSFVAPISIGIFIRMLCTDGDAKFIYTNCVIEWLKKEV